MSLLKGQLDPTLFNATNISVHLKEAFINNLETSSNLNFLDVTQELIDKLEELGIIK